jgi:hypothetical protein
MDTDCYNDNADAKPHGKADTGWFVKKTSLSMDQTSNKHLNRLGNDLAGIARPRLSPRSSTRFNCPSWKWHKMHVMKLVAPH